MHDATNTDSSTDIDTVLECFDEIERELSRNGLDKLTKIAELNEILLGIQGEKNSVLLSKEVSDLFVKYIASTSEQNDSLAKELISGMKTVLNRKN